MIRNALLGAVIACSAGLASAQVEIRPAGFVEIPGSMEFSGRVIVRPHQADDLADRGLTPIQIEAMQHMALVELSSYQTFWYEELVDHHVIVSPANMHENQVIANLMATGLFEYAEPDWRVYPIGCPNDTRFNNQWHHDASKMDSCAAWDIHTGNSSVTVGICDTGIETTHSDFQLHRQEGYNAVDRLWENQGGNINAVHPHGTQTTGCAAANGDNNNGVSGVGWNLSHRMMRVSNSSGGSSSISTLTHAALTSVGAGDRVANVSYSGVTSSSVRTTGTQIKNMGGLLTWSAGNNGANLNWGDRDDDDVIVVGATTSSDSKSSFSAFGASVDLMAPGSSVYTTSTGNGYASVSGTSFSAPLTAGLIALIWSADPSLTPDEVESILKAGCDDLGSSGVDNTYGYGRINSFNSLSLLGGGGNTPPNVTISSPSNNSNFTEGDPVTFAGSASDNEDGDITANVTWTSSIDGAIGSGAGFTTSSLSVGTHVVTASVSDSGGANGDDTVTVIIDPPAGSEPNAPDGVVATNLGNRRAQIDWNDNSDNEVTFEIQREKYQSRRNRWRGTTLITGISANSTSYSDRPGTGLFRYRVRATNANGDSAWSDWAEVTVTRR